MSPWAPPTHPVTVIPYGEDPLYHLCEAILSDQQQQLPDLTGVTILLPDLHSESRLRGLLLQSAKGRGYAALLAPRILRLQEWIEQHSTTQALQLIPQHCRELILQQALGEQRQLFGGGNLWSLAESLLRLFDELTLNGIGLPDDLQQFRQALIGGYGYQEGPPPQQFEHEAFLVHTLWHAWHQQLERSGYRDHTSDYLERLAISGDSPTGPLYLAGFSRFYHSERHWLRRHLERGNLSLLLHGGINPAPTEQPHPDNPLADLCAGLDLSPRSLDSTADPYSQLLDTIYAPADGSHPPLRERATRFATTHPVSPASGRLSLCYLTGAEAEANTISLQIRRWLLAGVKSIAVVTENRRLARRLRALLERSGIELNDRSGWTLSTTSAAALLERWLECIEDAFPYLSMLDLVKSPFYSSSADRDTHLRTVYQLEQGVIHRENIANSLQRYLAAHRRRLTRISAVRGDDEDGVSQLLEHLSEAATPISALLNQRCHPAQWVEHLTSSLEVLGCVELLGQDAAGGQLLELLMEMGATGELELDTMSWEEFRSWLGRTIERSYFRPDQPLSPVLLSGLGELQLARFGGVIIASAEREFFPGDPSTTPFFNDSVRQQMGLVCHRQTIDLRFHQFRRVLEAAPLITITLRHEQDGEPIVASPWVERISTFHQLAYEDDLADNELIRLARDGAATQVSQRHRPLPECTSRPQPAAPQPLLPSQFSATTYQQLLDCPYQFYSARILRLSPSESIREAMEKSDYGEKVHRTLEAFHSGVAGLPGPFRARVSERNKDVATKLLGEIARAEFARDIEDNFVHRDWLARWLTAIPNYIHWQLGRDEQFSIDDVELRIERTLAPGCQIKGRIDRVDKGRQTDTLSLIDYKTGNLPKEALITDGESIQLPFYYLLTSERGVAEVGYLEFKREGTLAEYSLQGDRLPELAKSVGERLTTLLTMMRDGSPLPAWGDTHSCRYCSMAGLCRRDLWIDKND